MPTKRVLRNRKLLIVGTDIGGVELPKTLTAFAWTVEVVDNLRDAVSEMGDFSTPVIVTESVLPDGSWRDVIDFARDLKEPPHVVVTSRTADERLWAEVLNVGGFDLLVQPVEVGPLIRTLEAAFRDFHERSAIGLKRLAQAVQLVDEYKPAVAQ